MRRWEIIFCCSLPLVLTGCSATVRGSDAPAGKLAAEKYSAINEFVAQNCLDCHNATDKKGSLVLEKLSSNDDLYEHQKIWESVVRKLSARQMPPPDAPRPKENDYKATVISLETALDAVAAVHTNAGRTETVRRLNRTEYQNAIRDLLALEIDAAAYLPNDESSHGFDNVSLANLSPTLMDRYITAAQKISRLAIGDATHGIASDTFRVKADITQEEQVEGLPPGTRGGDLISYNFPQAGEYEIQVWLARDRNEHVEGLTESHEMLILLDREQMAEATVNPPPPRQEDHSGVDKHLKFRIAATAGPHELGVTFLKNPSSLLETKRQPYEAHFNMHRHPRISPAVFQVSITGPYSTHEERAKSENDSPSRKQIFICRPEKPEDEEACAKQIVAALARRAYRRPVDDNDLETPLKFCRQGRADGDFDSGIELSLSSILVNPKFLIRVEQTPADAVPNKPYRISDLELASRLSFFIWSSIPDEELLDLATKNELSKPDILRQQVRRMLTDHRADNLVSNFAGQWLYLRNLESVTPDQRLFPDFDDNLRQALRRETELLFESVVREDRSVLDLLTANYTFLNERLAKHYGIDNVYGSRFRRVELTGEDDRGGLLRQGSLLTVTSYATRTSPVIRGKWILENLLGSPPPRPPANVPSLKDNTVDATLSVRERLQEHRANAACAVCHQTIDPVGFSLEEFDAIGRHRSTEQGKPIDAAGALPDGSQFVGVAGLEQALLHRPEIFIRTLVEKLFTFGLGREVQYYDAPAIRKIVRDCQASDNRFSSVIIGIVESTPFQMRNPE